MSEFVDRRMERGLQELEQMVKVGLFTSEEIRSVVTKRMKMEYGVARYGKTVEDHLKYIKYEMSFLELIRLRRKRLGYDFKFNEIEGSVGKRCQLRLLRAESRYPASMEIWHLHIELCKSLNWNPAASQVFSRMLQIHSDKPDVWMRAADFELNDNGSPDSAREICMKALRWHGKNEELWRYYLTVELKIAHKVFQRAEILGVTSASLVASNDPLATGKLAMVVVRNAMSEIPSVDFAAGLYETVMTIKRKEDLPVELCQPLSDFIIQKMEETFGTMPGYWRHRARFCLLPKDNSDSSSVSQHSALLAESAAFKILDAAIERDNSDIMWQTYMDFFVELYTTNNDQDSTWTELMRRRFEKAQEIFNKAESRGAIDFSRHINWAQILLARRKIQDALVSLTKATAVIPDALEAFVKLIDLYGAIPGESGAVETLIKKARKSLPKTHPEYYRQLISWTSQFLPENAEVIFKEAVKQTRHVVSYAALLYVQWAYGQGVSKGRKVYEELRKTPGAFTESLVKWVTAEEIRLDSPISVLRGVMDAALAVHGVESVDLWIDYIQLELTYSGGDALKSGALVYRAQRTLKSDAVSLFMSMYNLIVVDESST